MKLQSKQASYLSFHLDNEEFAIHVKNALNILEMCQITVIPQAPIYMKGVINFRGSVLPVVDLRIKLGMHAAEYSENTCIIVLELNFDETYLKIGIIIDEVQAVLEINDSQIQPPPRIGSKYQSDIFSGIAKLEDKFIMLIDVEKIFSMEEVIRLEVDEKETTKSY